MKSKAFLKSRLSLIMGLENREENTDNHKYDYKTSYGKKF